jgi:hypothetical protein
MALTNTYREDQIAKSPKQAIMVNDFLEESPILARIPVQDASHELHNVYEEIVDVDAAQLVDGDDALPVVDAVTGLKQVDLSIIGGIIRVGEDKAKKFGGAANYFASKQPMIFRKTGNELENTILYNNLRAYANTNGKLQDAGGTTADKQNSIIAVTWKPGEVTGLVSPNGFGNKEFMDVLPMNGGNVYEDPSQAGRPIYGLRYKSYFGMQLANQRYVSGIANVDIQDANPDNWDIPSEEDIEIMLNDCRAQEGFTEIYCAPVIWRLVLSKYKAAALRTMPTDRNYDRLVNFWDNIPIFTSYNFDENAEKVVS